jgi:putative transposase
MILTKKIRIYLPREAADKLWQVSYLCKDLWNAAVEQRRDRKSWGKVNLYSQKKELPGIKEDFPEYKTPSSQVLQNVLFGVDRSYKMFFTKRKNGDRDVMPPGFKSFRHFFTQEYSQPAVSFTITEDNILRLAYGSRPADWINIPVTAGVPESPGTVTISKQDRKWYACFTYEVSERESMAHGGTTVYFDPGCKTTLTGFKTTGEFIEYDINPLRQFNLSTYRLIDELTSKRDKKIMGSYHWRRLNRKIKKLFSRINTRTKTYLHSLANRILSDHPDVKEFRVGDWNKQETLADAEYKFVNRRINRAVQNNNPVMRLIEYLSYKGKIKGQAVKKFDERGTTRTCVMCDHEHKNGIDPGIRIFVCENCSFQYPRDHHSCLNDVKKSEPALWQRLSGNLPDRSARTTLSPFSFKPQVAVSAIRIQNTGCFSLQ